LDGKYDSLEEFEIRVENFVLGTEERRRNECGPRLCNAQKGYAWELQLGFDRDRLREPNGAQLLAKFFRDIMTREPSAILFDRFKDFLFKDKVGRDDDCTRLWTRRKRLHRRCREAGCPIPEILEVFMFLEMLGLPEPDRISLVSKFSDPSKMTMVNTLQVLRQFYAEKRITDFSRRPGRAATAHVAACVLGDLEPENTYGAEDDEGEYDDSYYGGWNDEDEDDEIYMAWMEDILVDEQAMVTDADHSADEELQEACLSFLEAKDHLNKLRIARGFYPVVAALPEQRSSTDRDRGRSSSKGKGKDKGRGRSKGKGRGSSSGSSSSRSLAAALVGTPEGEASEQAWHQVFPMQWASLLLRVRQEQAGVRQVGGGDRR